MFRFVVTVISVALINITGASGENIGYFASIGLFFTTYFNDYIKLKEEGLITKSKKISEIKIRISQICKFISGIWFILPLSAFIGYFHNDNGIIYFYNNYPIKYYYISIAILISVALLNSIEYLANKYIRKQEYYYGDTETKKEINNEEHRIKNKKRLENQDNTERLESSN